MSNNEPNFGLVVCTALLLFFVGVYVQAKQSKMQRRLSEAEQNNVERPEPSARSWGPLRGETRVLFSSSFSLFGWLPLSSKIASYTASGRNGFDSLVARLLSCAHRRGA